MFEDFFTTYNKVEPPEIYKDTPLLITEDINNDIPSFDLDTPTFKEGIMEYPGVTNPFTENNQSSDLADYVFNNNFQDTETNFNNSDLLKLDIEDLLKQEGITSVNGKSLKFGNKNIRTWGKKTSHHRRRDPHTGNASARDISIIGGTSKDYADFRNILLNNQNIRDWMLLKGWGIINEITPLILSQTGGTGNHFHFGPDTWARNTWKAWNDNPNVAVTTSFRHYTDSNNTSNTSNDKFKDNKLFATVMNRAYQKALQEKGIDTRYSLMLVAQDAQETGWGQKPVGKYNYGNITISSENQSFKRGSDGNKYRNYSSLEEYVNAKINILLKPMYKFFSTFKYNSNISVAMQTLANRGYARGNYSYGTNVEKVYKSVLKYLS